MPTPSSIPYPPPWRSAAAEAKRLRKRRTKEGNCATLATFVPCGIFSVPPRRWPRCSHHPRRRSSALCRGGRKRHSFLLNIDRQRRHVGGRTGSGRHLRVAAASAGEMLAHSTLKPAPQQTCRSRKQPTTRLLDGAKAETARSQPPRPTAEYPPCHRRGR